MVLASQVVAGFSLKPVHLLLPSAEEACRSPLATCLHKFWLRLGPHSGLVDRSCANQVVSRLCRGNVSCCALNRTNDVPPGGMVTTMVHEFTGDV